ncbi:polymeric immunoglobulin receptor-like isoform X2 [Scomber scombrus]
MDVKEDGLNSTSKYPRTNQNFIDIDVDGPRGNNTQSTKKDEWETKDIFSLYDDTKNKTLRVAIEQLQKEDFGEYWCNFYPSDDPVSPEPEPDLKLGLKLVNEKDVCKKPFIQTAYETAKTTITCDYPDKYKSKVKFICKDNDESCEEILSTSSPVKSNRTFTLTNTNSGFNMSISNVSSQHAGVYWCGVKQGRNRASILQVYTDLQLLDRRSCTGSTAQVNRNTGKFSMQDSKEKRNITITVRDITTDDTGTYWCGAETNDNTRSKLFYHKFNKLTLTVVPPPVPYGSFDQTSWLTIAVALCLDMLLLLLMFIVFFVYELWTVLIVTPENVLKRIYILHSSTDGRNKGPHLKAGLKTCAALDSCSDKDFNLLHCFIRSFQINSDRAS